MVKTLGLKNRERSQQYMMIVEHFGLSSLHSRGVCLGVNLMNKIVNG